MLIGPTGSSGCIGSDPGQTAACAVCHCRCHRLDKAGYVGEDVENIRICCKTDLIERAERGITM